MYIFGHWATGADSKRDRFQKIINKRQQETRTDNSRERATNRRALARPSPPVEGIEGRE